MFDKRRTMKTRAGFVTIIGLPNAGKSTLMNALIGEQLSVITHKPQTTRKRVLGIVSEKDYQIVFLDTPGILKPNYMLQERMMEYVKYSAKDTDLLLCMVDAPADPEGELFLNNGAVKQILEAEKCPKVLAVNKIDKSNQEAVQMLIDKMQKEGIFNAIVPISAMLNDNLKLLLEMIVELLPTHPKYYPDDQLTDEPERFFVSEIIRSKVFALYRDEIPYSTEVLIDEFKERAKGKDYIAASVVVEKASQKPIIIGKNGDMIKKLGQISREAVEEFLQRPVYLEVHVKVRENWRKNPNQLNRFGYTAADD